MENRLWVTPKNDLERSSTLRIWSSAGCILFKSIFVWYECTDMQVTKKNPR